jgi:hypothetical protein
MRSQEEQLPVDVTAARKLSPGYVLRAAKELAERGAVELRNRKLDADFLSDRAHHLDRINAAVDKGIVWFLPIEDLTMSALFVLERTRAGLADSRFDFIDRKIARYRATIRDAALRLFDRAYDPAAPALAHLPDIMAVRPYQYIEQLMVKAVCADQNDLGEDFLRDLEDTDDRGGYGTTHIVAAGTILKRFSKIPAPQIEAMMRKCIPSMTRRNRTGYPGDQFCERVVMLQWLDRHDLVPPAWILRILAHQNPDGGWQARGVPPEGQSNQHTTCLALAALAEFHHHWASRRGA